MKPQHHKFPIFIRVIAAALAAAFIIQDISWAYPNDGYRNLAVTGLQNQETQDRMQALLIKKHGGQLPHARDVNASFGEGVGLRHIVTNNVIAFHDMTMGKKGPSYYKEFYEMEIQEEKNPIYNEKIIKATRSLKFKGIYIGAKALLYRLLGTILLLVTPVLLFKAFQNIKISRQYYQTAMGLQKDTTFIFVDMPTRLLHGEKGKDGKYSYQLSHLGRTREIIFISKKALDDFDIDNSKDMDQLATVLNHDRLELDLMRRDHGVDRFEAFETFEGYEKRMEELHKIAKKSDPFNATNDLEKRIKEWVMADKSVDESLGQEIDRKVRRLKTMSRMISEYQMPPRYVYKTAVTAMQIGYAHEVIGDEKNARAYYNRAFFYFLNVTSIDEFLLPIFAQINMVRLSVFLGDYSGAANEFKKIVEFRIGGTVPGVIDIKFKEAIAPYLARTIREWLYEMTALMLERAEQSGNLEDVIRAYSAIEEMTPPVLRLLEEEEKTKKPFSSNMAAPKPALPQLPSPSQVTITSAANGISIHIQNTTVQIDSNFDRHAAKNAFESLLGRYGIRVESGVLSGIKFIRSDGVTAVVRSYYDVADIEKALHEILSAPSRNTETMDNGRSSAPTNDHHLSAVPSPGMEPISDSPSKLLRYKLDQENFWNAVDNPRAHRKRGPPIRANLGGPKEEPSRPAKPSFKTYEFPFPLARQWLQADGLDTIQTPLSLERNDGKFDVIGDAQILFEVYESNGLFKIDVYLIASLINVIKFAAKEGVWSEFDQALKVATKGMIEETEHYFHEQYPLEPAKRLCDAIAKNVTRCASELEGMFRNSKPIGKAAFSEDAQPQDKRYRKLLLRDASVDKDYFELLFQANMDLLILSKKRMLAKEGEDTKAYEDVLGEIKLLAQNIKTAIDEFEKSGREGVSIATTKYYRELAKEHLNNAVSRIEAGNEQAANRAIWAALADIAKDREEMASLTKNIDRKFFKAFRRGKRYILSSGFYESIEGSRTTMRVGGEAEFDLLWQAFASCDDQREGELLDRFVMKDLIGRIDKALNLVGEGKLDEAKDVCLSMLWELGTKKKVEEKRLGIIALGAAIGLLNLGDVRTAKDVLNIARRFFITRFDNTKVITEAIETGKLSDLRALAVERNSRIIRIFVNPVLAAAYRRDFKPVKDLLGRATRDFMKEPEFRTFMPLVWKCIYDIKAKKDTDFIKIEIDSTMEKLAWRARASRTLGEFMSRFTDTLSQRAIEEAVDCRLIKKEVFRATFQEFLKKPGLIRGSPDLFWTILYQAAFIPLKIDNLTKKSERISNPLFEAIDALILLKVVDDLSILLSSPKFIREHHETAAVLRKLNQTEDEKALKKIKRRFTNLKPEEKASLLAAIARDYNLSPTEVETLMDAASKPKGPFSRGGIVYAPLILGIAGISALIAPVLLPVLVFFGILSVDFLIPFSKIVREAKERLQAREKPEIGKRLRKGFEQILRDKKAGPKRLLDIGAGAGEVTTQIASLFDEVWVMEQDPKRINLLKVKGIKGLRVIGGDFFDSIDALKGKKFDAIVISHSLLFIPFKQRDQFLRDKVLPLIGETGRLAIVVNSNVRRPENQVEVRASLMRKHDFIPSGLETNLENKIKEWGYPVTIEPLRIVHEVHSRQEMSSIVAAVLPQEDRNIQKIDRYVDTHLALAGGKGYKIEIDEDIMWVSPRGSPLNYNFMVGVNFATDTLKIHYSGRKFEVGIVDESYEGKVFEILPKGASIFSDNPAFYNFFLHVNRVLLRIFRKDLLSTFPVLPAELLVNVSLKFYPERVEVSIGDKDFTVDKLEFMYIPQVLEKTFGPILRIPFIFDPKGNAGDVINKTGGALLEYIRAKIRQRNAPLGGLLTDNYNPNEDIHGGQDMEQRRELLKKRTNIPSLINALGSFNFWVSTKAILALRDFGDLAKDAVLEAIESKDPRTRGNACAVLGLWQKDEFLPVVVKCLKDQDIYVVRQAIVSMERTVGIEEADRILEDYPNAKGLSLSDRPENVSRDNPEYVKSLRTRKTVAVFSMEGHIPELSSGTREGNFAGGLGIYFGDLLEGLKKIGINAAGFMPLYSKQVIQRIKRGKQVMEIKDVSYEGEPLEIVKDNDGKSIEFDIWHWDKQNTNINKSYHVKVYKIKRAGAPLYLFWCPEAFDLLYPLDQNHRYLQETFFAKCVSALFKRLSYKPDILHLNEGHVADVIGTLDELEDLKKSAIVYVNHSVVPAALQTFRIEELDGGDEARIRYVMGLPERNYQELWNEFVTDIGGKRYLDMSKGALKRSDVACAVSEEHAEVTQKLFSWYKEKFIPVLNGSGDSWVMPELLEMENRGVTPTNEELKKIHDLGRELAFKVVKERTSNIENKEGRLINEGGITLDPKKPTVWLYRRMAEYKSQLPVLREIIGVMCADKSEEVNTQWGKMKGLGMQVVVGGVGNDQWAEEFVSWMERPDLKGRFAFVTGGKSELLLAQAVGADICINSPLPGREASGTSDQRSARNGGINIATRSGGPPEYIIDGKSGFLVGPYNDKNDFDARISKDILDKLVVCSDMFYAQKEGDTRWSDMMFESYLASRKVTSEAMAKRYASRVYPLALNKKRFGPPSLLLDSLLEFDQREEGYNFEENPAYRMLKDAFGSKDDKKFLDTLEALSDIIYARRKADLERYHNSRDGEAINLINLPHNRILSEMLCLIVGADVNRKKLLENYLGAALKNDSENPQKMRRIVNEIVNNYGLGEIFESATEYGPFYFEGGVGTVMSQYPHVAATEFGLDIKVALPLYEMNKDGHRIKEGIIRNNKIRWTGKNVSFYMAGKKETIGIYNAFINGQVVIFLDHPLAGSVYMFHKKGHVTAKDHCMRRIFMSRSLLELIEQFKRNPKFIVANDDWTTLVHFYRQEHILYKNKPRIRKAVPVTRWHNPTGGYQNEVPYVAQDGDNLFNLIVDDLAILSDPKKSWEIQEAFRHPFNSNNISFGAIGARYSNNLAVSKGLAEVMGKPEGRTGLHTVFGEPENKPLTGIHEGINQLDLQRHLFGPAFIELLERGRVCDDSGEKLRLKEEMLKIVKRHKASAKGDTFTMYFPKLFTSNHHTLSRAARAEMAKDTPLVLFMGRIVEQKGLQYLLHHLPGDPHNILERLIINYPKIKFVFAGPPGDRKGQEVYKRLEYFRGRWPDNIFLRGNVGNRTTEWYTVFRGADLIIMPSTSEPCGMVNLEGESAGTAIAGPDLEGLRTGIIDFTKHPDIGNGFKYDVKQKHEELYSIDDKLAVSGLYHAIDSYLKVFYWKNKPGDNDKLNKLILNCVTTDNRWEPRIQEYLEYFRSLSGAEALEVSWKRTSYFLNNVERNKSMLRSGNIHVRRKAAAWLSWMQEDGLAVLKEALFSEATSDLTKIAAAYGLRRLMHRSGRLRKMALDVFREGLANPSVSISRVSLHGLFWVGRETAQRYAEEILVKFLDSAGEDPSKEYVFEEIDRCFKQLSKRDTIRAKDKFWRIWNNLTNAEASHKLRHGYYSLLKKEPRGFIAWFTKSGPPSSEEKTTTDKRKEEQLIAGDKAIKYTILGMVFLLGIAGANFGPSTFAPYSWVLLPISAIFFTLAWLNYRKWNNLKSDDAMPLVIEKARLRNQIKAEFKKQTQEDKDRENAVIKKKLLNLLKSSNAKTVAFYMSRNDEVDTWNIIQEVLKNKKKWDIKVVVPRISIDEKNEKCLVMHEITNLGKDLEKSPFKGLLQPTAATKIVPDDQIDVVIVPGRAFDRNIKENHRLGRGGGDYDRYLEGLPKNVKKIGLAFGFQIKEEIPVGASDIPVDMVITSTYDPNQNVLGGQDMGQREKLLEKEDEISQAVQQVEIDERIKNREKIRPIIEDCLRQAFSKQSIDPESWGGQKILEAVKNSHIVQKEHYFKHLKHISLGFGLVLASLTIIFGVPPLIMTGIAMIIWRKSVLEVYSHIYASNEKDMAYQWTGSGGYRGIALPQMWEPYHLTRAFESLISSFKDEEDLPQPAPQAEGAILVNSTQEVLDIYKHNKIGTLYQLQQLPSDEDMSKLWKHSEEVRLEFDIFAFLVDKDIRFFVLPGGYYCGNIGDLLKKHRDRGLFYIRNHSRSGASSPFPIPTRPLNGDQALIDTFKETYIYTSEFGYVKYGIGERPPKLDYGNVKFEVYYDGERKEEFTMDDRGAFFRIGDVPSLSPQELSTLKKYSPEVFEEYRESHRVYRKFLELKEKGAKKGKLINYDGKFVIWDPDIKFSSILQSVSPQPAPQAEAALEHSSKREPSETVEIVVLRNNLESKYMVALPVISALSLDEQARIKACEMLERWLLYKEKPKAEHVYNINLYIKGLRNNERKVLADLYFALSEDNEEIEGWVDLDFKYVSISLMEIAPWNRIDAGERRKYKGVGSELRTFGIRKLIEKFGDAIYEDPAIHKIAILGHKEARLDDDVFDHKTINREIVEKFLCGQDTERERLIRKHGLKKFPSASEGVAERSPIGPIITDEKPPIDPGLTDKFYKTPAGRIKGKGGTTPEEGSRPELSLGLKRLDASPNLLWTLIRDNPEARQEFRNRYEFLLKNDIVKALKDELLQLSKDGKIIIRPEDIEKIDVVLFGDWFWRPKNASSNDLDIQVIFRGEGEYQCAFWTSSDIPPLTVNIRNLEDFKKETKLARNLTAILRGSGVIIYGGGLVSEIEFKPLLAKDILEWAKGLLDAGYDEEALKDLSEPRRQWKRCWDALLYIQHLLPKQAKDDLGRFLKEYIDSQPDSSKNQVLISSLGEDFGFKDFFVQYYLGNIELLPWSMPKSKDLIGKFRGLVHRLIKDLTEHLITLKTDRGLAIEVWWDRFPDGEFYLRILNPELVKDANVIVSSAIDSPDDLVRLVLLIDMLRRYGAKNIQLISEKPYNITNGLDEVLRYNKVDALKPVKEKRSTIWVDRVLYRYPRLEDDVREAAVSINAKYGKVEILGKEAGSPLNWHASLPENLKGENVILVHNTQYNEDIVELWIMLVALRRAGVASISLVNTYEGYARQDKIFEAGEGVSAVTMSKITDALVDNHMALNIHYGKRSGWVQLEGYQLYNLNTFVQVAEKLVDVIAEWRSKDALAEEFQRHPILLISPDDGAFGYVQEAADLLPKYIKEKYNIDVEVHCGYMDKQRISATKVRIVPNVLGADGKPLRSVGDIKSCWAFVLDDETSQGSTILAATYALVRRLGIPWQRVLTGVVHGKLVRGLEPFETGWGKDQIKMATEPKPTYINEDEGLMAPRLIVSTESLALSGDFPEEQKVSIGPIVGYAVKRIIGAEKNEKTEDGPESAPQQTGPAGSISNVFNYLCKNNITNPDVALTGQEIGKELDRSYETIKYDIRALYYHLYLLEKAEGTGREARFFVPEAVRKKSGQILPILERFRGKDLRPNISLLKEVYQKNIKTILEEKLKPSPQSVPLSDTFHEVLKTNRWDIGRGIFDYITMLKGIDTEIANDFEKSLARASVYADAGCGIGRAAVEAADLVPQLEVYGIDATVYGKGDVEKDTDFDWDDFIGKKGRVKDRYAFIRDDITTVRLPKKADVITALFVLQYVEDPLRAFANLYNQLSQGGRLYVMVTVPRDSDENRYYEEIIRTLQDKEMAFAPSPIAFGIESEDALGYFIFAQKKTDDVLTIDSELARSAEVTVTEKGKGLVIKSHTYSNKTKMKFLRTLLPKEPNVEGLTDYDKIGAYYSYMDEIFRTLGKIEDVKIWVSGNGQKIEKYSSDWIAHLKIASHLLAIDEYYRALKDKNGDEARSIIKAMEESMTALREAGLKAIRMISDRSIEEAKMLPEAGTEDNPVPIQTAGAYFVKKLFVESSNAQRNLSVFRRAAAKIDIMLKKTRAVLEGISAVQAQPAVPKKLETISEAIPDYGVVLDADIQNAIALKTSLAKFYDDDAGKVIYTIRLDSNRVSPDYMKLLKKHYARILSSDKVEVNILGNGKLDGLVEVEVKTAYGESGRGVVEVRGDRNEIASLARLIGMVNLAISIATLPAEFTNSNVGKYDGILDIISAQYQLLTGKELVLPADPKNIVSFIRARAQDLPPAKSYGVESQEEFRLMEEKLERAA